MTNRDTKVKIVDQVCRLNYWVDALLWDFKEPRFLYVNLNTIWLDARCAFRAAIDLYDRR